VWFTLALTALAIVITCGLYVRRRVAGALEALGVRPGRIRAVRWGTAWLLLAFPLCMVAIILASRLFGLGVPRFDGPLSAWLFTLPFAWVMLVALQSALWVLAIDGGYLILRRRRGVATATRARAFAVLAVVGVFGLYTPARILIERDDLRVRRHAVAARTTTGAPPLRIAFLADVQQSAFTGPERAREVYAIVNASQPDLVLVGGDWIDRGPDHIASAAATAAMLRSPLGTFSVRGDHEHFVGGDRDRSAQQVERALADHGIAMLDNEVRWFERGGRRIAVAFLGYNYIRRAEPAAIAALVASIASADYRIVVSHQLDAALAAQLKDRVDLVLGGHTHGGQVNPVLGVVHVNLARAETAFVDGRYRLGATDVIVTAGVGFSIVPFRYAAPASVEIIDLAL
jgi:predicted MPP superfamily phosphohydrolase